MVFKALVAAILEEKIFYTRTVPNIIDQFRGDQLEQQNDGLRLFGRELGHMMKLFPAFNQSTDVYRFVSLFTVQCSVQFYLQGHTEMDMYVWTVAVRML